MASPHHRSRLKEYLNSHKKPCGEQVNPNEDRNHESAKSLLRKVPDAETKKRSALKQTLATKSSQPARQPSLSTRKVSTNYIVRGVKGLNIKGNNVSFDWLPDELLLKIFSYLDVASLMFVGQVCKRWSGLSNENVLWEPVYGKFCRPKKKAVSDDTKWKKECIKQCVKFRNNLAFPSTKKKDIKSQRTSFKKLACQFRLTLTNSSKDELTIKHSTLTVCTHSLSVMWCNLQLPPIGQIRNLQVHAHTPLFFDQQQKAVKNSPCTRSLLLDMPFEWRKWSSTRPPGGSDDRVNLYFLSNGLFVGTWKEDGELAFIALCLHIHNLRERCLFGSGNECFMPIPHAPILDDIDSQYGLHDYSCFVELRNQKRSIWSQEFIKLYCKKEKLANGYASLSLIRPDRNVDHTILTSDQRLELPWRTDLFEGVIKNVCVLDLTLEDERGELMWDVSSLIKVTPSGDSTNYDYDGDTYTISLREERGNVNIELVWVPEREQYFITGLTVQLSLQYINDWFGTNY